MELCETVDREWEALLTLLPEDLDESAFQSGALVRKREVQSASVLLRLAMAYSVEGRSLRQTAAWARAAGIADMSDVALLKRLKSCPAWLGAVLARMLADRACKLSGRYSGLRVRLLDATTVSRHGSKGTDWRIHVGYDLGAQVIDHVELTDEKGGETFTRHPVHEGELVIGDAGYAHRKGIHRIVSQGGHVMVRLNWQNVPLTDAAGSAVDITATLQKVRTGPAADIPVWTAPDTKAEVPAVAGRLVAIRKTKEAAERARRRVNKQARKKGRKPDARTLLSADYIFVFTTLPPDLMSAEDVLEFYRFRWQIEIAFKRLKGILELDEMAAQDERLCRTFLFTKLIAALLIEQLTRPDVGFSPWGYGRPLYRIYVAPVPAGP